MCQRILVVDDEPSVQEVARGYLEREGFEVLSATNGLDGLAMVRSQRPDVIVLDLTLPGLSGQDVCSAVRRDSDVGIVMLTARSTEAERIHGLELGADDYLVKPFSPRELVARVRAVMRRTGGARPVEEAVDATIDGRTLRIDPERHQAVADGVAVDLTPSEYRLLATLAGAPGRVYSRLALIKSVQGHDYDGYERTIDAHVKNLRRKIETDPACPRWVETVHGVGYRLASGQR